MYSGWPITNDSCRWRLPFFCKITLAWLCYSGSSAWQVTGNLTRPHKDWRCVAFWLLVQGAWNRFLNARSCSISARDSFMGVRYCSLSARDSSLVSWDKSLIQGTTYWVLEAASWMLAIVPWVLGRVLWVLGIMKVLGTGPLMLDTDPWMTGTVLWLFRKVLRMFPNK